MYATFPTEKLVIDLNKHISIGMCKLSNTGEITQVSFPKGVIKFSQV